ncbi:MAG: hypothetical protein WAZ40_02645 [Minisyncoccia bacterium]
MSTTIKYPRLDLGQIEAIVNKLGGMEGVQRFLSGEMVIKASERNFPIWKTIRLGTGLKTPDDFRAAIKAAGMYIGDWGNDILGKPAFTVSPEETEVDLVVVSNADLGFKDGTKLEDTYARALELGLELCPNEVGPQLRLQYTDQPNGEWLLVAMEPIIDSDGFRGLFGVKRDDGGGRYLNGYNGGPDRVWGADARFVFRRRK